MNQPLAYIHPEAKIARNVVIEPFTTIDKNVEIGEGTWIGSHVTISEGARIGKNCKIYPGACIAAIPQDLKFSGEDTQAVIGDESIIREYVTISRGTKDKFETRIGEGCLIMAYVHVAHDCIIRDQAILVNNVQMAGHVEVGEWAIVGGSTAIHQFVKIGSHVMVAGGSLINKDLPPFIKAARYPISYTGINSIGLRRRGYTNEKINEIQEIYRIIYQKGYNHTTAMDVLEMEIAPSKERDEVISFFQNTGQGVVGNRLMSNSKEQ